MKIVFPKLSFETVLSESSSEVLQRCSTTTATNGPLAVTSWWIATVYPNKRKYTRSFGADAEEASLKIVLGFSYRFFLTFTLYSFS